MRSRTRRPQSAAARLDANVLVAGVDEAGRGPLAGPVYVAAVILDRSRRALAGLDDSKQLPEARRDELDAKIRERALAYSVVAIDVDDIDRVNIFQATMLGMRRALDALALAPALALIDGNRLPKSLRCDARAIVDGDAREPAISAASILAKVARDRHMRELDARHPGYGFAQHKGYGTPEHLDALKRLGPCAQHRRSFAPVRALLEPGLFDALSPDATLLQRT
ncbi:ribonuclease HII [Tahibacter soli]|uniref:Ribonuclease HII n=1 Tax=Tahibacter soli TaxID=2983605 RepID=A0A9X3YIM7_9GAMM|nr:ribonuclease HII [Tahibacter soli]MDC8012199.1 ribonuclease HII [Tahibacter soli]